MSNTLMLRVHPAIPVHAAQEIVNALPGIQRAEAMLAPHLSLSLNSKLLGQTQLQKSQAKVERILRAEQALLRTFVVRYTGDELPEHSAARYMRAFPEVELAEPYYLPQMLGSAVTPNDPRIGEQSMLETIEALEAWDIFEGDENMIIAISDSGIFQQHEDLRPSLWTNSGEIPFNGKDDDNNGQIDDYQGCNFTHTIDGTNPGTTLGDAHGTSVTGIVGATGNNGIGMAGVGNKCRIFPMKILPTQGTGFFGYQSIVYAATMGFKVVNCSWGGLSYSETNRSVIEYALSRDLAVAAGAGNHADTRPSYPAGYPGVLSVGVSHPDDRVVLEVSAIGPHVNIMTPGQGALTTQNDGGYGVFHLTSAATPIGGGALAIARSRWPQLDAEQATHFVRLCTDNIEDKNPEVRGLIPGRLNLLKVVSSDPFSTPSISPLEHHLLDENDVVLRKAPLNRVLKLRLDLKNHLGAGQNLRFTLSTVRDGDDAVEIVQAEQNLAQVDAGAEFRLQELSLRVLKDSDSELFLRVDISGDNEYRDYFLLSFVPSAAIDFATFENEVIRFSLGDRGTIGFSGISAQEFGVGFRYKDYNNLLFQSGLIVAAEGDKVVSAVRSSDPSRTDDDFAVVEGYEEPNPRRSIVTDGKADPDSMLGVRITQEYIVPTGEHSVVACRVQVENISGAALDDLAIGYLFDWDIGPLYQENQVGLFYEGPFPGAEEHQGVIGYTQGREERPVTFSAVYSEDAAAVPQFAGFDNDPRAENTPFGTNRGFAKADKYRALHSGTLLSYDGTGDVAGIIGVRFPGSLAANESRSFILFFGAVELLDDVEGAVEEAVTRLKTSTVAPQQQADIRLAVYPQPGAEHVVLSAELGAAGPLSLYLRDLSGRSVLHRSFGFQDAGEFQAGLDCSALPAGIYLLELRSPAGRLIRSLILSP